MTTPIIETAYGDVLIQILETDDGYRLEWTDGVANFWGESYETLSVAVGRLAVLIACGEGEWAKTFTRDAIEHARMFDSRIHDELTEDPDYTTETIRVRYHSGETETLRLLITDGWVNDTHPEWHNCFHAVTNDEWAAMSDGDELYPGVTFVSIAKDVN